MPYYSYDFLYKAYLDQGMNPEEAEANARRMEVEMRRLENHDRYLRRKFRREIPHDVAEIDYMLLAITN